MCLHSEVQQLICLSTGKTVEGTEKGHLDVMVLLGVRVCPEVLTPHLQAIAARIQELWQQGLLRPAERNVLCEALLAAAPPADAALRAQVTLPHLVPCCCGVTFAVDGYQVPTILLCWR